MTRLDLAALDRDGALEEARAKLTRAQLLGAGLTATGGAARRCRGAPGRPS